MRACPSCSAVYATEAEYCGLDGERLIVTSDDPLAGKIIVKYRLEELLGMGSSGCVYRTTNLESGEQLAIKILFGEMTCDRRVVERFRREAEAASKMTHHNIVRIHDFGSSPSGLTYLAMELLLGRTLETAMGQEGPFQHARAASIAQQISAGLAEAHRLGFVHRDLKPGNVMLLPRPVGDEIVKILDFGIAMSMKTSDAEGRLTKTGYVVGTPLYMAPEQIDESAPLGPPADVYALGAILYEMLAGRPPHVGSVEQVLVKKMTRAVEPLPGAGELGALALKLLERDPELRPPSALHVSAELVRMIDGEDPNTEMVTAPVEVLSFNETSHIPTIVGPKPQLPARADAMKTILDEALDPAEAARIAEIFAKATQQRAPSPEDTAPPPNPEARTTGPPPSLENKSWSASWITYALVMIVGIAIGLAVWLWSAGATFFGGR